MFLTLVIVCQCQVEWFNKSHIYGRFTINKATHKQPAGLAMEVRTVWQDRHFKFNLWLL